jgi:azurin
VADESVVEIEAVAGLRYDPVRFQVAPKSAVRLVFRNADDMAHNLVFTKPGARIEVVNAALTLPITPEQTFVPASDKVLWHVPVVTPGKSATLEFTAPETEGAYPFVCTYPGHGFVMFGAMYVSKKTALPPFADDENLPEVVRAAGVNGPLHAFTPQPPYLYRNFLRDSGPASIAVALPGQQNYCWDAGTCRLRFAWSGAFLDPTPQWAGKGDAFAEVLGRIYYRAPDGFPLRLGARDKIPTVKFRGYRLVERFPEFFYEIDGAEVRELIKPLHHGGIEDHFTLGEVTAPVFFVGDPNAGAQMTSNTGAFPRGVLELTPQQARIFTITSTEAGSREPIGYWSMDDSFPEIKPLPVMGVRNRALVFDGKKAQLATKVNTSALSNGATFLLWVKAASPAAKDQVALGARTESEEFALGWNLAGNTGFGYLVKGATGSSRSGLCSSAADEDWHQLGATFSEGKLALFYDGQRAGGISASLPANAPIVIGSEGGTKFAAATLDEVRIYDRALSDDEIRALYDGDRRPPIAPPAL